MGMGIQGGDGGYIAKCFKCLTLKLIECRNKHDFDRKFVTL